uniref:Uncharacterized protein n=1 Tax=viral metagenome TaxID=1070528 RepID=A0A6H1ZF85_9ZZZZ
MIHLTHKIHSNSLEALTTTDIHTRLVEVLKTYTDLARPITDREVARYLDYPDMNAVRPRITELKNLNIIEECGKVKDEITGKKVRLMCLKRNFKFDESGQGVLC